VIGNRSGNLRSHKLCRPLQHRRTLHELGLGLDEPIAGDCGRRRIDVFAVHEFAVLTRHLKDGFRLVGLGSNHGVERAEHQHAANNDGDSGAMTTQQGSVVNSCFNMGPLWPHRTRYLKGVPSGIPAFGRTRGWNNLLGRSHVLVVLSDLIRFPHGTESQSRAVSFKVRPPPSRRSFMGPF
jgi:hypothetical protein